MKFDQHEWTSSKVISFKCKLGLRLGIVSLRELQIARNSQFISASMQDWWFFNLWTSTEPCDHVGVSNMLSTWMRTKSKSLHPCRNKLEIQKELKFSIELNLFE
jgi:hypothetical protein